jgi:putative addiction module killer protein
MAWRVARPSSENHHTRRIARLKNDNPGDVEPVGDGVSEMRIRFGPGYRVYFTQRGLAIAILLGGGSKKTQDRDIKAAKALAAELDEAQ